MKVQFLLFNLKSSLIDICGSLILMITSCVVVDVITIGTLISSEISSPTDYSIVYDCL